jgi:preprotein translocase subunit SecE
MIKKTKAYRFFDQVKQEVRKIVWPEKKELATSVLIVVVTVFLFSMVCIVLDYSIHSIVKFLLNLGK